MLITLKAVLICIYRVYYCTLISILLYVVHYIKHTTTLSLAPRIWRYLVFHSKMTACYLKHPLLYLKYKQWIQSYEITFSFLSLFSSLLLCLHAIYACEVSESYAFCDICPWLIKPLFTRCALKFQGI